MAKDDGTSAVMSVSEMRPLLHLSKRQPVNCAVGLTKDKQGVILLHRRTKPRKLMADLLKKQSNELKLDRASLRFGHASVDGASDSTTVHFTINKASPDTLRLKLLEQLRPVGFQHCDVIVDGSLETEAEDDADEGSDDDGDDAGDPDAPVDTQGQPAAAAAGAGPGQEMPGRADAAPTRHPPGSPVFAKGQTAWIAVRAKLHADIDGALKGMEEVYADDARAVAIRGRVEPILNELDDSLAAALGAVAANAEPAAHARLVADAGAIVARYRAFVDGEPMIAALDDNPFHPVALRTTLDAALAALSKVVEAV